MKLYRHAFRCKRQEQEKGKTMTFKELRQEHLFRKPSLMVIPKRDHSSKMTKDLVVKNTDLCVVDQKNEKVKYRKVYNRIERLAIIFGILKYLSILAFITICIRVFFQKHGFFSLLDIGLGLILVFFIIVFTMGELDFKGEI